MGSRTSCAVGVNGFRSWLMPQRDGSQHGGEGPKRQGLWAHWTRNSSLAP